MEFFAWLGSFLLGICALPQSWKSIKDKETVGVSPYFFVDMVARRGIYFYLCAFRKVLSSSVNKLCSQYFIYFSNPLVLLLSQKNLTTNNTQYIIISRRITYEHFCYWWL